MFHYHSNPFAQEFAFYYMLLQNKCSEVMLSVLEMHIKGGTCNNVLSYGKHTVYT